LDILSLSSRPAEGRLILDFALWFYAFRFTFLAFSYPQYAPRTPLIGQGLDFWQPVL